MATHTATSAAHTSVTFSHSPQTLLPADLATIANGIRNDLNVTHPVLGGAFAFNGLLFIPNRGVLKILQGDVVAVGPVSGWPLLIAGYAAGTADWTIV